MSPAQRLRCDAAWTQDVKGRVGPNCIVESMSSTLSTGRIMEVTLLDTGAMAKGRVEAQPSGI